MLICSQSCRSQHASSDPFIHSMQSYRILPRIFISSILRMYVACIYYENMFFLPYSKDVYLWTFSTKHCEMYHRTKNLTNLTLKIVFAFHPLFYSRIYVIQRMSNYANQSIYEVLFLNSWLYSSPSCSSPPC